MIRKRMFITDSLEKNWMELSITDSYAASGSKVLSSWDCVFNGDVTSWIKFANSLRLRLALHLAYNG